MDIVTVDVGGAIEAFMINVWIKETNFYGVVLKKEREKREAAAASGERPFAEILKEQWEEKKRELAAAEARAASLRAARCVIHNPGSVVRAPT